MGISFFFMAAAASATAAEATALQQQQRRSNRDQFGRSRRVCRPSSFVATFSAFIPKAASARTGREKSFGQNSRLGAQRTISTHDLVVSQSVRRRRRSLLLIVLLIRLQHICERAVGDEGPQILQCVLRIFATLLDPDVLNGWRSRRASSKSDQKVHPIGGDRGGGGKVVKEIISPLHKWPCLCPETPNKHSFPRRRLSLLLLLLPA